MLEINGGPDKVKFDSLGCRNPFVEVQPLEPASELRFAGAAVTQDEHYQFSVQYSPGFQIVKVSADFADDVLERVSANFGWKVVEPTTG